MNDFEFISNILKNITCSEVGKGGLTVWIGFGDKIKVKGKAFILSCHSMCMEIPAKQ